MVACIGGIDLADYGRAKFDRPRRREAAGRYLYLRQEMSVASDDVHLNQIPRPGYCRAPRHCQSRGVPILINGLVDHNRAGNHNQHSYSGLEHCVHGTPNDARQTMPDPLPEFSFRATKAKQT